MKRFFNIIPGKDAACILLYGEIGEYDRVRSGDIARELIEAESASKQIDVRINSIGGDIFTGMAISTLFVRVRRISLSISMVWRLLWEA